jgi:hypothetical protein
LHVYIIFADLSHLIHRYFIVKHWLGSKRLIHIVIVLMKGYCLANVMWHRKCTCYKLDQTQVRTGHLTFHYNIAVSMPLWILKMQWINEFNCLTYFRFAANWSVLMHCSLDQKLKMTSLNICTYFNQWIKSNLEQKKNDLRYICLLV